MAPTVYLTENTGQPSSGVGLVDTWLLSFLWEGSKLQIDAFVREIGACWWAGHMFSPVPHATLLQAL